MLRLRRSALAPVLLVGVLLLACALPPARAASLRVRVDGVGGQQKVNVETFLSIKRLEKSQDLSESRIRHLHEIAPQEIATALEPFGYYRSLVESRLEREGDRWNAAYEIAPGAPVRFDTVAVRLLGEGAQDPELRAIVEPFALRSGDPVDHARWEFAKSRLSGLAHVRGYLDGRFLESEITVDPERYAARLDLAYDTGPRYHYGPVRFHQDALHERYLEGYVPFEPGDPMHYDELRSMQNTLRGTNYFKRVEVEPRRSEANGTSVPVDVTLQANKPLKLDFGATYGTDEGFGVTVGALARRVNRRGHRADLLLKVSQGEQSATANYRIPWADPPTSVLSFSGGYERKDTEARISETFLLGGGFSHLRGPWQETWNLAYRLEDFEVGPDTGRVSLFGPDLQWTLVQANDRVYPTRGHRVRAGLEGALGRVLSSASYAQANLELKGILGFANHHRVIARARGGTTLTKEFRELPASVRYFSGGALSVRGYEYESLAPHDEQGREIGGQSLLETSLEYEFRFHKSFGVAGFYDAGSALASTSDRLSSGVGFGVRWLSPVGMIRLDHAWALSEAGVPTRIHFSIGPDL